MFSSSRRPKVTARILLEGDDVSDVIRTETSVGASQGLHCPLSRGAAQRSVLSGSAGLVADGRTWVRGFSICTTEDFLNRQAEERARRRYLQLKASRGVSLSSLLDEIRARDERDTQRAESPAQRR